MYDLKFGPVARGEFEEAYDYFRCKRRSATVSEFEDMVIDGFAMARRFPEALPLRDVPRSTERYRRVVVWHFVFLYRVDHDAEQLLIERIAHERTMR